MSEGQPDGFIYDGRWVLRPMPHIPEPEFVIPEPDLQPMIIELGRVTFVKPPEDEN